MGSRLAFNIFSDGGGERASSAGAACIIRDPESGHERKIALFLGGGTNNESEIIAGLIGFSFLRAFEMSERVPVDRVHWVSDSEYVLKSASDYIANWQTNGWRTANRKPVKNQGLWRAYLALSEGLRIKFEHVRGHAGHPENEACDTATTWLQVHGESMIDSEGEGQRVEMPIRPHGHNWVILDGRAYLEALRNDSPPLDAINLLAKKIQSLKIANVEKNGEGTAAAPQLKPSANLLNRLTELQTLAGRFRGTDPTAAKIEVGIGELLKKISKS